MLLDSTENAFPFSSVEVNVWEVTTDLFKEIYVFFASPSCLLPSLHGDRQTFRMALCFQGTKPDFPCFGEDSLHTNVPSLSTTTTTATSTHLQLPQEEQQHHLAPMITANPPPIPQPAPLIT